MSEQNRMRIYTCNACRYTFEDAGEPDRCPDCGKTEVRPATPEECREFNANRALSSAAAADEARNSKTPKSRQSKDAELERVITILQQYLQESPLLDLVWSDKFGHLLISIPFEGMVEDATVIRLNSAERLVAEVYQSLYYDYVEQFGDIEHCEDATPVEIQAMREWMRKYTDLLPEYDGVLDDILDNKKTGG